ncbi:MAG: hypothetical protein IJ451_00315, partial [Ruminococcus sp.]|nr:hypothetical protein [Ruminococcus sp.]
MAQKNSYRYLTVAVMAMVLAALFALTTFAADVTGGFGTILGVENGSYEAASVTISADGTGIDVDTDNAITLSDANNKDLAGLYAVSSDSFKTQTIVYVYGAAADRADLRELWEVGDIVLATGLPATETVINSEGEEVANPDLGKWQHGTVDYFAPGYVTCNKTIYTSTPATGYFNAESHFGYSFIKEFVEATDDAGREAAYDKIKASLTSTVYRYALTEKEIIPINLVKSLSFYVNGARVYSNPTAVTTGHVFRFKAYILLPDGTISVHTNDIKDPKETMTFNSNDPRTPVADFTDRTAWDKPIPQEGYFLGYEFYPYYGLNSADQFSFTFTEGTTITDTNTSQRFRLLFEDSTYSIDLPQDLAPAGITVNGTTFENLDGDTTYYVAPFHATGADTDNVKEISGVTEYDVAANFTDPVGLYGIYTKGDGTEALDSVPVLIYVSGSYSARKDIHETNDSGYYMLNATAKPGYFSYKGSWATNSAFGKTGICSVGDHISHANFLPLYNAYIAEDATVESKKAAFEKMLADTGLERQHIQYTFTSDEIIPISQVKEYSYSVQKNRGGFTYNNQVSEFEAIIMGEDGKLRTYVYKHRMANLGSSAILKVVDFVNDTSANGTWTTALPEDGYLVGFRIYIYANLDDYFGAKVTAYDYGTRYNVSLDKSYVITLPTVEKPEGITVEGTTFKNLAEDKTYVIAPVSINGAETDSTKIVTVTGVTSYTLPEDAVGLYGISLAGDGETTSNSQVAAIIYVRGTYASRKEIGTFADGATTPTAAVGTSSTDWVVGEFRGVKNTPYVTSGKGYPFMDNDASIYSISGSSLIAAQTTEETKDDLVAKEAIKSSLELRSLRYAYNPDEILPVSELLSLTVGSYCYTGTGTPLRISATPKVYIYVMAADGTISEHVWTGSKYYQPQGSFTSTAVQTVDVQSIAGLPAEGWVVGIKYQQMSDIDFADIGISGTGTTSNYATATLFGTGDYYVIAKPKLEAPTGITVEGTTFKGLDSSKTYSVAAYTLAGADADVKTVTGVEEYDIST